MQRFELVENIFIESCETYCYRKMQWELAKQGLIISEYYVLRMMWKHGLYPITNTKYRPYRNGKIDGQYSKDLVSQHFQMEERNKVW
ncbi:MAG: transposase [Oscillospiraceae bacterium]|nr:transposase [Oscillospiraceae bacterium]